MDEIETPESSNVAGGTYDPDLRQMTVRFRNGDSYTYHGVDAGVWEGFKSSDSKGSYVHRQIKGRFRHTRGE
jgi:hypothetical protein